MAMPFFFENTLFSQFANESVISAVIIDNPAAQSLRLRRILEFSENRAVRAVSHIRRTGDRWFMATKLKIVCS
jgi:hypothetical protein